MRSTRTRTAPRSTSTSCWRSASAQRHRPEPALVTAVLAAAGSGERLGAGGPKALVNVAGRPLYQWSLEALRGAESVGSVVVAFPPGAAEEVPEGVRAVTGGPTRAESVASAVAAAPDAAIYVIHDAARPLLTAELVDACVDRLVERPDADGVIAAAPVTDTVKRAREARAETPTIAKTESRDHLWAAQTPQVFRAERLRAALAADPQRVAAATDEAMTVEKEGGKVIIEPSSAENLKVTTPTDLRLAELLLRAKGPEEGR